MNRQGLSSILAVALFAAPLGACSSKSGAKAEPSSSAETSKSTSSAKPTSSESPRANTSAVTSAVAEPPKPAGKLDPKAAGPAFFYFAGAGTYMMDSSGKLTKIGDYTLDGADFGPDGRVYLGGINQFVVEGGKATKLEAPGSKLAAGPDGTVWTVTYQQEVAKQDASGTWTKEKIPGSDEEHVSNIAVDAKGDIYAASMNKIFAKRSGTWSTKDVKELFKNTESLYVADLIVFGGEVYVVTGHGVVTLDGKELKVPQEYGFTSLSDGGVRAFDGTLAMKSSNGILIITPDGKITEKRTESLPVKGSLIDAFALDTQGRRWIGAGDQLYILDKDDKVLQTWPVGSIPGDLSFVYVVGAGPELPPAPDPVVKANVKGRIVVDGAPVKNSEFVACGSPSMIITGATPCSGQTVELSGKTDDNGAFLLKDVPRARFGFAWKDGGKWKITLGLADSCCTKITDGQEFDMGDLTVKSN
ncbi:MAG: hypothetical protein U0414_10895 [Polyangiaceae bacterium]